MPIELQNTNTCAVQDGATVPIYYESRFAKLALDEAEREERLRSVQNRVVGLNRKNPSYRDGSSERSKWTRTVRDVTWDGSPRKYSSISLFCLVARSV